MSGGQVIEIGSFSNIPDVVPSNSVNWRKCHLNLCYYAEQDLQHHLSLSFTGGLLQIMAKGERSIIYTVYINVFHTKYSFYPLRRNLYLCGISRSLKCCKDLG